MFSSKALVEMPFWMQVTAKVCLSTCGVTCSTDMRPISDFFDETLNCTHSYHYVVLAATQLWSRRSKPNTPEDKVYYDVPIGVRLSWGRILAHIYQCSTAETGIKGYVAIESIICTAIINTARSVAGLIHAIGLRIGVTLSPMSSVQYFRLRRSVGSRIAL